MLANFHIVPSLFVLMLGGGVYAGSAPVHAGTEILVNSTDDDGIDANPGNGVCETIPGNGKCTLRAAVMEANASPGADTIRLQGGAIYVLTRPNPGTPGEDIVGAGGDLDLVNDDVTIIGNGATVDGNATERVFQVAGNIAVEMTDLTIRNGLDGSGGGIFTQGQLTLTRCTVANNQATSNGGGIYTANGVLTLNSSTVRDNQAPSDYMRGGGIYVASGSATVNDSWIVGNTSHSNAGGILNSGTLALARTIVTGNTTLSHALLGGAGISNGGVNGAPPGGTITIEDSTISANNGGGVANNSPGNITITRSTIASNTDGSGLDNRATATLITTTVSGHQNAHGAGIFNTGTLNLRANSVVRDNSANSGGTGGSGILNSGSGAVAHIEMSTIRNNTAANSTPPGGGIANVNYGTLTVASSVIAENTGGRQGGGIYGDWTSTLTITGSTIRDNRLLSTYGNGIGVYAQNDVTVRSSVFTGNVGGGSSVGGGLSAGSPSTLTMSDCTFFNNQTSGSAGLSVVGTATVERCSFFGNTATAYGGGGVGLGGSGTTTMTNCTISGNNGGGMSVSRSGTTANLTNVTIAENSGVGLVIAGVANMVNTIVANNSGTDCSLGTVTTLGHNIDSDDTCGLSDPTDLPGMDPLLGPLADNGGTTLTHRLRFGSPAIDTGNDAACPNHDQRVYSRPADGDGDGITHCDIGAYE